MGACHSALRNLEGEILLADWDTVGTHAIRADVCVPGVPGRIWSGGRDLPSMVVLKIFHLGALLMAHRLLEVSKEWCFILSEVALRWESNPPPVPALGAIWCELSVLATVELRRRERILLTWECALMQGGRTLAAGHLRGWIVAPRRYRALRRGAPSFTPASAGAPTLRPVLAPAGEGWTVSWEDGQTPAGHPGADHVPPIALVEAALAATRSRAPETPLLAFHVSFPSFAERDSVVRVDLSWDETEQHNIISMHQGERAVAVARLQLLGRESLRR